MFILGLPAVNNNDVSSNDNRFAVENAICSSTTLHQ